jgi:hypothetical protein
MVTGQQLENALKNAGLRPPIEALIANLPIAKPIGQVAPWNTRSIPIHNRFDK